MKLLATTDRFALGAALALRGADDELLVLGVGRERAERELRHGLAMGAERAVRVWDQELAQALAEPVDGLALATVLAAAVRREQPDVVLCPAQSPALGDDVAAIALAGLLDFVHVHDVLAVERDGERLAVQRRLAGGRAQRLRVALPALLAIRTRSNAPQQPDLRAVKRARQRPLAVLSLRELALDGEAVRASAGAHVTALHERLPGAPSGTVTIEGTATEIAARILEIARERVTT